MDKRPRGPRRPRAPLQMKKRQQFGDPVPVHDSSMVYSTNRGDKENGLDGMGNSVNSTTSDGVAIDHHVKIVVVGDGGTGKTCMLVTYATGKYPTTYVPTVFENYLTNVKSPTGKMIELAIWDTAGQEDYDRLRPLSYPDTNVLLVCFSVDQPVSLENVVEKWIPEITMYCPGIPFILIGLKIDLRTDSEVKRRLATRGQHILTPDEGKACAKRIGAYKYMECSAKNRVGLSDVFNTAMSVVISPPKLKNRILSSASSAMQSRSSTSTNNPTNSPSIDAGTSPGYNPYNNNSRPNQSAAASGRTSRLRSKNKRGNSPTNITSYPDLDGAGTSRRKKRKACIIL